ncbi:phosphoribosylglycinamide formyltransferase [archaeon]|mgnify:FL=1|jgi:phosphoribosylglycinamide formyltransferase-1|nr:phosphoribosylglycinamide formyltransferase [archaeon]MDP6547736.1 phosphoribosylglycinamide formyltransferase [Candidatus Woesearchaeota archaeon]|tara:strand:+ start:31752 stop:32363 length:612 start_codon:yes stop_codon:yes gene_type:complete
MINIGILASTKATDMQAIIDAIEAKKLNAKISVVISNKEDSYALVRAKNHNIDAVFIDSKNKEREEFDKEINSVLKKNNVDLIILIGYMRWLSEWFVKEWKNKIINIHPSLLPDFAGGMDKDVHEEVLKSNVKTTGCTLHFVDESKDNGPIILQKEVNIDENETIETLKEKVQKAEQEIILRGIKLFDEGKIKVDGGKVRILE